MKDTNLPAEPGSCATWTQAHTGMANQAENTVMHKHSPCGRTRRTCSQKNACNHACTHTFKRVSVIKIPHNRAWKFCQAHLPLLSQLAYYSTPRPQHAHVHRILIPNREHAYVWLPIPVGRQRFSVHNLIHASAPLHGGKQLQMKAGAHK